MPRPLRGAIVELRTKRRDNSTSTHATPVKSRPACPAVMGIERARRTEKRSTPFRQVNVPEQCCRVLLPRSARSRAQGVSTGTFRPAMASVGCIAEASRGGSTPQQPVAIGVTDGAARNGTAIPNSRARIGGIETDACRPLASSPAQVQGGRALRKAERGRSKI